MRKIVILGAGFGGLRAAYLISKKLRALKLLGKYGVVLIDRSEHHTFTPLLYQVATTAAETANLSHLHEIVAYGIRSLLGKRAVSFVRAEVVSMDLLEGDIHLANGEELIADFLVLALGSETNYFGIPGLKENSLPLKTFKDAIAIRDALGRLAENGKEELKVLIGGGGPTGVELASELRISCGEKNGAPKCKLNISLLEALPSILGNLHPKIISLAEKRLKKLGVEIMAGEKIISATQNKVALEDGKTIPFDLLIWTGGIKSPAVLGKLPLHTEAHGKPVAADGLECIPQTPDLKLRSRIYGLGDSICFYNPKTGRPIPAVAPAAIIQGEIVAHNIIEEIKRDEFKNYKPRPKTYLPKEYPYIIPVGGKYAIAKIGPFVIPDFDGWVVKGLVELNYLLSIMPFWKAMAIWFKGLMIFIRNDRLG